MTSGFPTGVENMGGGYSLFFFSIIAQSWRWESQIADTKMKHRYSWQFSIFGIFSLGIISQNGVSFFKGEGDHFSIEGSRGRRGWNLFRWGLQK